MHVEKKVSLVFFFRHICVIIFFVQFGDEGIFVKTNGFYNGIALIKFHINSHPVKDEVRSGIF